MTAPDLARPYRLPLSGPLLYAFFAPQVALCLAVVALADRPVLLASSGLMVLGVALLVLLDRARLARPHWFSGVEGVAIYHTNGQAE